MITNNKLEHNFYLNYNPKVDLNACNAKAENTEESKNTCSLLKEFGLKKNNDNAHRAPKGGNHFPHN